MGPGFHLACPGSPSGGPQSSLELDFRAAKMGTITALPPGTRVGQGAEEGPPSPCCERGLQRPPRHCRRARSARQAARTPRATPGPAPRSVVIAPDPPHAALLLPAEDTGTSAPSCTAALSHICPEPSHAHAGAGGGCWVHPMLLHHKQKVHGALAPGGAGKPDGRVLFLFLDATVRGDLTQDRAGEDTGSGDPGTRPWGRELMQSFGKQSNLISQSEQVLSPAIPGEPSGEHQ